MPHFHQDVCPILPPWEMPRWHQPQPSKVGKVGLTGQWSWWDILSPQRLRPNSLDQPHFHDSGAKLDSITERLIYLKLCIKQLLNVFSNIPSQYVVGIQNSTKHRLQQFHQRNTFRIAPLVFSQICGTGQISGQ